MGRIKKELGKVINRSVLRLSAMEKINVDEGQNINYGSDTYILNASGFRQQIERCKSKIDEYNGLLAQADAVRNDFLAEEIKLAEMYSAILKGAFARFGSNANQIEMLGGTRKSERKKRRLKKKVQE